MTTVPAETMTGVVEEDPVAEGCPETVATDCCEPLLCAYLAGQAALPTDEDGAGEDLWV